ncbi:MAG TPA: HK97-gp10 family putative phage morphogenesis protein [Phycisphaerales bacterium]|nr:HK97-gp10 family putative phage morphogenesis protein [Phycisphaerales bacterium]
MAKNGSNTAVMRISGGDQIRSLFEKLPGAVAMKMARRVLYAAAGPIRDAARAKATSRYGILKRSVIVRTGQAAIDVGPKRKARGGDPKVYVTIDPAAKFILGVHRSRSGKWSLRARKLRSHSRADSSRGSGWVLKGDYIEGDDAFIRPRTYAHLVEFGTRPHATGKGSQLKDRLNSKRKGSGVQFGHHHPGARARPFMRPAFDSQAATAGSIIVVKAQELLAEETSRLYRYSRKA